jgi:hypothetical protein
MQSIVYFKIYTSDLRSIKILVSSLFQSTVATFDSQIVGCSHLVCSWLPITIVPILTNCMKDTRSRAHLPHTRIAMALSHREFWGP